MTKTWVTADPHWGHAGVCRFTLDDGVTKLRPWDNPDDMDVDMIKAWNAVVKPEDRVYVLGDLAINRKSVPTIGRCHGRKVLVKGNHDIFDLKDYLPFFDDIRAYVVKKTPQGGKLIMSHIPIHEESLGRWGLNIHGHLHAHTVKKRTKYNTLVDDKRYVCVSVEQTNFTPILLEEAVARGVPEDTGWYKHDASN